MNLLQNDGKKHSTEHAVQYVASCNFKVVPSGSASSEMIVKIQRIDPKVIPTIIKIPQED